MAQIEVYVRKTTDGFRGRESEFRDISFRIPGDITHAELLKEGWAIDGNQAIMSVQSRFDEDEGRIVSMAEALHQEETALIELLQKHNHEVVFA